ncbi:putative LLM family oxidoreductase [Spinactinospora alkalitolerans]|uniref:Putative LLM family oxidoreductase n=1 Tax=Spinactinospora alkalitolerans TaxID=687207 RepID=A0A852TT13_9ACTN|nr:LLM class flavin-dependent oxidoreductase [Spinactinospora alkalitolerans]NYE45992.1 putative LLM family oxidoreductase [Spinactinospora alkalitolerans]
MPFELGIYHFGEITEDPHTGEPPTHRGRLRDLVEQARLADQVGLDLFAAGEHHRTDFVISAPAVVLAAMAERTENIRLSSAVTVLSSDDPVRVFQQFATLDLLSGGRAEIIAGRGSYIESFPLFGYDLDQYSELFAEKLDLLLRLREENPITWSGRLRPPLRDADVTPRPERVIPVWVAVGGTPASVVRAAQRGLPLALGIIGGGYARFAPFVELYRERAAAAGYDPSALPVSINSPGFLAPTSQQALDISYPYFDAGMTQNFHRRGHGFHTPPEAYAAQSSLDGAYLNGSPQQVVDKILAEHEVFGHRRQVIQMGFGDVPQKEMLRSIELLGTEVAPVVRKEIAARTGEQTA